MRFSGFWLLGLLFDDVVVVVVVVCCCCCCLTLDTSFETGGDSVCAMGDIVEEDTMTATLSQAHVSFPTPPASRTESRRRTGLSKRIIPPSLGGRTPHSPHQDSSSAFDEIPWSELRVRVWGVCGVCGCVGGGVEGVCGVWRVCVCVCVSMWVG